MARMADPKKVEAVRQLLTEKLKRGEVLAHDPGMLEPVEFHIDIHIDKQRIRLAAERFADYETAEDILLSRDALPKAMLGDSFLLTKDGEFVLEYPGE